MKIRRKKAREKQLQKQTNACETVTCVHRNECRCCLWNVWAVITYATHFFHLTDIYSKILNKKRQQKEAHSAADWEFAAVFMCVKCIQHSCTQWIYAQIIWSFILWIAQYFRFIFVLTLSFEMTLHRCTISSLGFRSILSPFTVCINFVPSTFFLRCVQTVIVLALNPMFLFIHTHTHSLYLLCWLLQLISPLFTIIRSISHSPDKLTQPS